MTRARKELVDFETTPYYHCICRCVRRAFLWGVDNITGRNYEHRREWVLERLRQLQDVFAIDVCAYAIMSNHYHLVVRLDREQARAWPEAEVVERWAKLFSLPVLVTRYQSGLAESVAERTTAQGIIAEWRERLADLSWFMRSLNEYLARRANEEDGKLTRHPLKESIEGDTSEGDQLNICGGENGEDFAEEGSSFSSAGRKLRRPSAGNPRGWPPNYALSENGAYYVKNAVQTARFGVRR